MSVGAVTGVEGLILRALAVDPVLPLNAPRILGK